jgi:hypothetical protein
VSRPPNSQDDNVRSHRTFSPLVGVCVILFFCATLHAQETCNAEAKILLLPEQRQAVVAKLKATKRADSRISFFDTTALDLMSQGVILRLRQGVDSDLTVKLRPPAGRTFSDPSAGREDYKCEVDLTATGPVRSYSIRRKYGAERLPATGSEIFSMLSPGQKKLLEEARVSIDWTRVRRIADIRSIAWQIKRQPDFDQLTLELWEWPAGEVLELSTKVQADAGPSAYAALQQLIKRTGLSISDVQEPKTSVVLRLSTDTTAH